MLPGRMQDAPPEGRSRRPVAIARTASANWGFRIFLVVFLIARGPGLRRHSLLRLVLRGIGPEGPGGVRGREGASGSEIVDGLHEQGVVRCGLVSKWLLRRSGLEDRFRAGTFELTTNMTPDEAFEVLTTPPEPVPTVRLTIPEGYRLTQIAERVEEDLGIPAKRFLRATGCGLVVAAAVPARGRRRASRGSCSPRPTVRPGGHGRRRDHPPAARPVRDRGRVAPVGQRGRARGRAVRGGDHRLDDRARRRRWIGNDRSSPG